MIRVEEGFTVTLGAVQQTLARARTGCLLPWMRVWSEESLTVAACNVSNARQ